MSASRRYRAKGPLPAIARRGRQAGGIPARCPGEGTPGGPGALPPKDPANPYTRHYTKDRSFAELVQNRNHRK